MGGFQLIEKSVYGGRTPGKIDASLSEKLSAVEWGEYSYHSLFESVAVKRKLDKSMFNICSETPVFSAESANNGIAGYTKLNADFVVDDKHPIYVVFGDHTRSFNFATRSFCVTDNVKVLRPIITYSMKSLMFITSAWRRCIPDKGYARHWSLAEKAVFQLPTRNGKIDFDFMENFIAELEAQRYAELEAYFLVTGLKDTRLSLAEEQALADFDKIRWEEYRIIDIFTVKNTHNILSSDIKENSGLTPYLGAGAGNNSVLTYISYDKSYIENGSCIFIGGKTFVVTYQKEDFYSNDSHNLALYVKDNKLKSKSCQLMLASCIYKSLSHKYYWGDSVSHTKIQKDKMMLPTKNGEIDFDFMENLIYAIQKLVIKDVVDYADRKLAATKKVCF